MVITGVDLTFNNGDNYKNLILTADIVFDYEFKVFGIQLFKGIKGPYLMFPINQKTKKPSTYPINNEMRLYILNTILEAMEDLGDIKNE